MVTKFAGLGAGLIGMLEYAVVAVEAFVEVVGENADADVAIFELVLVVFLGGLTFLYSFVGMLTGAHCSHQLYQC